MSANSRFLNLDTDGTLSSNSDERVPSQKAIKTYVDSHSGGGADIDNASITQNSNNKLQAVGLINQNNPTVATKEWIGTKAQYDAIATKDPNTRYITTDEGDSDLSTKANRELDNLTDGLTNTICFTPATTTSTASSATPAVVVENYVNGTSWYRVWSDGWCEQGGREWFATAGTQITFLKAFKDTNYTLTTGLNAGDNYVKSLNVSSILSTSFTGKATTDGGGSISSIYWWKACGYIR